METSVKPPPSQAGLSLKWLKMVLNPFLHIKLIIGFLDECILSVFRDGTSRSFPQLLGDVDFSDNTLRSHLRRLMDRAW